MRFASSITAADNAAQATEELLAPLNAGLTLGMVDVAFLFATRDFDDELPDAVERIGAALGGAALVGCTAEGTIGRDRELERVPSMSLLAAEMPGVTIRPFHITQRNLESVQTPPDWERFVGVSPESRPTFLVMTDPFRLAVYHLIDRLNEAYPSAPLIGGVASAARMPGQNRLIVNGEVWDEGAVGVALTGRLDVRTAVSQGCRPIGKPFVVTKGHRNIIQQLGGLPALEQLRGVLVHLSAQDEQLARQSLFVGRVIDEHKERFTRGDFLIHNIIGVDRGTGAIAIAGHARVGATVQFHVRDAAGADEDLRAMLTPFADAGIRGALLFGCNGRGTHMWPKPGHDVGVFRELLGDVPVAGCFCGGEFGPVGGRNFVHGFTASFALFREPPDEAP